MMNISLHKIVRSFLMALSNIKSRLMHTFLSVLGIVIGVGALVAIISMIDGMEKYATDQVSTTTSLNMVVIQTSRRERINGVYITKDSAAYLTYDRFQEIQKSLTKPFKGYFATVTQRAVEVVASGKTYGAVIRGVGMNLGVPESVILAGRGLTEEDLRQGSRVAIVNSNLAKVIATDSLDSNTALGETIRFNGQELEVVGILKTKESEQRMDIRIPITFHDSTYLASNPPISVIWAMTVEDVEALRSEAQAWIDTEFPNNKADFIVETNTIRVAQIMKGFLVFRIVMGLIVGISVVVGGIGVMNVLLISVTERTSEIGVRKALGANRGDIVMQFLAEAVTVSIFGSFLGLLLGIGVTMVAVPIIKSVAEISFHAAYTWGMLATVGIVAVLVGVVFGTYPAIRASRLDPVEAIRRE